MYLQATNVFEKNCVAWNPLEFSLMHTAGEALVIKVTNGYYRFLSVFTSQDYERGEEGGKVFS